MLEKGRKKRKEKKIFTFATKDFLDFSAECFMWFVD